MPVAEAVSTHSIAESMLAEFETQAAITRKFLSACPKTSSPGSPMKNP